MNWRISMMVCKVSTDNQWSKVEKVFNNKNMQEKFIKKAVVKYKYCKKVLFMTNGIISSKKMNELFVENY